MDSNEPKVRRSLITNAAAAAARRWQLTVALLLVIVLGGIWAYGFGLDREGFPPVDTPISIVTGTYFVDDAAAVDDEVVRPLADAFLALPEVSEVQSQALRFAYVLVVEFEDVNSAEGTEMLADLDVDIPFEATVEYRPVNAAKFVNEFDLLVSVVGPADAEAAELQEQADLLAAFLAESDDVASAEVRELLTQAMSPATGKFETRRTRFTRVAFGPGEFRDAAAIGVVRTDASTLDVIEFTDVVAKLVDDVDAPLAAGYDARITADFATGVESQLSSLSGNLLTGLIAVAAVSLLLIGWRVSFVTAGFMGVVLMGALIGLWLVGFTLNTITLFGLILTLGLLVDDAIVISESIDANRDQPDPSEEIESVGVIRTAIDRVGGASFAGTLTTMVVFSPMLFIGGILGEFIRPIPTTVIITLLLSFVFSILFIPMIGRLFLLRGDPPDDVILRTEKAAARATGRLASYPEGNGWKGRLVGFALAGLAVLAFVAGIGLAGGLGFSIFPSGKDSVGLSVSAEFPFGTPIESAEARAVKIDEVISDVLGDDLARAQYVRGNERLIEIFIDLTPIGSRPTKSPEFVERIENRVSSIEGARVTVGQLENGPPVVEFPFAVQITVDDDTVEAGESLAGVIADDLIGRQFPSGSDTVTVTDAIVSTKGEVVRVNGEQIVEVRAKYDEANGLSGILSTTEEYVAETFGSPDSMAARGLATDALAFDFGLESDNQEDFAALGLVGMIALGLMLLLITIQFRSLAQSLLIFLAIPFSFLGVFALLTVTDNPLSFLAVVGFIALIGVAVNNTILLVDAANQERRAGATAGEAIGAAVTSRFRPLVATTVTTVVGLLPLSLSDPFWEALGFTLMGGLISSTFLVLLAFPAFYLGLETIRTPVRNFFRRRRGRDLVV